MTPKIYNEPINVAKIKELEPYLNKYFGITYQHFSWEIVIEIDKIRNIRGQIEELANLIEKGEKEKLALKEASQDKSIDSETKTRNARRLVMLNSEISGHKKEREQIIAETPKWQLTVPIISGETKYTDFFNYDLDITLWYDFEHSKFEKLFNKKRTSTETELVLDSTYAWVILILAMVIRRRPLFESADIFHYSQDILYYKYYNEIEERAQRKDMLELYVFLSEIRADKAKTLTISQGKKSVGLSNHNHWVESYLDVSLAHNLSDINHTEQAKEELKKYAPKRGRKPINRNRDIVMWGIYYMTKDYLKMEQEMPNDLAEFIIAFLDFVGLPLDTGKRHPQNIKVQIDSIKNDPTRQKFGFKI